MCTCNCNYERKQEPRVETDTCNAGNLADTTKSTFNLMDIRNFVDDTDIEMNASEQPLMPKDFMNFNPAIYFNNQVHHSSKNELQTNSGKTSNILKYEARLGSKRPITRMRISQYKKYVICSCGIKLTRLLHITTHLRRNTTCRIECNVGGCTAILNRQNVVNHFKKAHTKIAEKNPKAFQIITEENLQIGVCSQDIPQYLSKQYLPVFCSGLMKQE
ncbi:hypothetical protein BCR33DRAFT_828903 [Rhizoclosmatium globosum]|uniref:Uncharacterized protein n=1 Tax=Rhizoclosmatium globosum TaxID=329046 RepID=A0A1Y2BYU3_9FUNG|nr:hypothetical protein BCR33DRAFT_828903 [Rhizoclosmatium globosum]|eukprot:ORY39844.1 hypothetical protein BCR33DRAFT_828903 [Rhizoclosmatium globosum]